MAEKIRQDIRLVFGDRSVQEAVFDSLLWGLRPSDVRFFPSFARAVVPAPLARSLDQSLLWFSFGPHQILEMRFVAYAEYDGEEYDLDGHEGLDAYLKGEYVEPRSGNVVTGAEVARRLFPYYVLTDSFRQALKERGEPDGQ